MFSGTIERNQWLEMGKSIMIKILLQASKVLNDHNLILFGNKESRVSRVFGYYFRKRYKFVNWSN